MIDRIKMHHCLYFDKTIDMKISRPLIGHSWWSGCCIKAMALHAGANQYTGPAYSAKACFMVVCNITTTVNKGRRAGSLSSLCI